MVQGAASGRAEAEWASAASPARSAHRAPALPHSIRTRVPSSGGGGRGRPSRGVVAANLTSWWWLDFRKSLGDTGCLCLGGNYAFVFFVECSTQTRRLRKPMKFVRQARIGKRGKGRPSGFFAKAAFLCRSFNTVSSPTLYFEFGVLVSTPNYASHAPYVFCVSVSALAAS